MTDSLRAWVDDTLSPSARGWGTVSEIPLDAYVHGIGTDVEHDLKPLWCLTVAARPRVVLELGTRRAISTRTLAHACRRVGALLFTCDPDPTCAPFLRGVPAVAFRCTGEKLFDMGLFPPGSVDVLFVDTDPHSFEQTRGWLDAWVTRVLAQGGVALFHDVNARDVSGAPRPDIQVKEAITAWLINRSPEGMPEGYLDRGCRMPTAEEFGKLRAQQWDYVALGHDGAGGLGVLRRRG